MNPLIFLIIAAGLSVASLACVIGAHRHGEKIGREREFWRLRRLFITRRADAEYELIAGHPVPRVLQPRRSRSAWIEAATGGAAR